MLGISGLLRKNSITRWISWFSDQFPPSWYRPCSSKFPSDSSYHEPIKITMSRAMTNRKASDTCSRWRHWSAGALAQSHESRHTLKNPSMPQMDSEDSDHTAHILRHVFFHGAAQDFINYLSFDVKVNTLRQKLWIQKKTLTKVCSLLLQLLSLSLSAS